MLTDSSGQAIFPNVSYGSHQANVSKSGYVSQTKTFNVTGDMTENFALQPGVTPPTNYLWLVALAVGAALLLGASRTRKRERA